VAATYASTVTKATLTTYRAYLAATRERELARRAYLRTPVPARRAAYDAAAYAARHAADAHFSRPIHGRA
jgi:hypothetical protein